MGTRFAALMVLECAICLVQTRAQLGSFSRAFADPRESLSVLASGLRSGQYFPCWHLGGSLENLYCLRCNRELEAGQKSVAVYMFAQTVGIRPRQKSTAQRICFCPQCSVSLAMGPPPEGALNLAAWKMIRELVGSDPALNQAAWETLRGIVALLPAGNGDGGQAGAYIEF